jgi:hypothetical protein
MAKINVDAGLPKTRAARVVAAVARSEAGVFLGASVVVCDGVFEPETLEAMAVREGLSLAQDLSLMSIKMASDCLAVVSSLKDLNLGKYSQVF